MNEKSVLVAKKIVSRLGLSNYLKENREPLEAEILAAWERNRGKKADFPFFIKGILDDLNRILLDWNLINPLKLKGLIEDIVKLNQLDGTDDDERKTTAAVIVLTALILFVVNESEVKNGESNALIGAAEQFTNLGNIRLQK